jgi:hypothetical protein
MGEAVVVREVVAGVFLLAGADLGGGFAGSSVFFLPNPNRLRFFFFSSPSTARGVALPVPDSDSDGSASEGMIWLPWAGAAVARLMLRDDRVR